jgi:hypothetical protein
MAGSKREARASAISPRIRSIRGLNDVLRRTGCGGQILITPGVQALSSKHLVALLNAIRRFDRFDDAVDPWFEHDMGSIPLEGERFFWKIDYYDLAMTGGSPDPADPAVTHRVMTIMRADEY